MYAKAYLYFEAHYYYIINATIFYIFSYICGLDVLQSVIVFSTNNLKT